MEKIDRIKLFTESVRNIALSLNIEEERLLYILLDMCNVEYNYLIVNELKKYQ